MCGRSYHDHGSATRSAISRKSVINKSFDPGPKQEEEEEEKKDEPEQGEQAGSTTQTTSHKGVLMNVD